MSKKNSYVVVRFDEHSVTLGQFGSISRRLIGDGEGETVLSRSTIASVAKRGGALNVTTTDGRAYEVLFGVRREQAALTRAAFGMPPR
jgi:hypothetical protein